VCAQVHLVEFRGLYVRGENLVWRAVVRLNVVRSVGKILGALGKAHEIRLRHVVGPRKRLTPLRRAQRDLEKHLDLTQGEEMRDTSILRQLNTRPGTQPPRKGDEGAHLVP